MKWKSLVSVLGALAPVILACAPSPALPSVTTPASTTTTVALTAEQAAREFRSCLGEAGLEVPDLPLDEAARPDLSALSDAVDQGSVEWREALTTCAALIVANGALDLSSDPELAGAVRAQLVAFSTCMRSQGVEGFPDPPPNFDGTTPPFPLSVIPTDDPELGSAAEACALNVGVRPPA